MISRENIQAIYPLMPKQRALAYYSLQSGPSDPGFIQMRFLIKGPLDKAAFSLAWEALLPRHESMRASLQSPKNKQSMLVVLKTCLLPIEWVDIRQQSRESQQDYINQRVQQSRDQGLDLSQAPVHRLLGIETDDGVIEFFWACHHLFLDGWSAVVLLNDLANLYSSQRSGAELKQPAASSHADYLNWLANRHTDSTQKYWADVLSGYTKPALISQRFTQTETPSPDMSSEHREHIVYANTVLGDDVESVASEMKVTTAAVVYAAWSVYLGALTQTDDVVFGTTTAGRAFDLPDSQIMTGYFANVIPKRYRLDKTMAFDRFVVQAHKQSFAALPHEHLPIDEIQSCAGIPLNKALFDNLVLFENLPQSDIVIQDPNGPLSIGTFSGGLTSTYPLTLTIRPDAQWRFKYLYSEQFQTQDLITVLDLFPAFLQQVCQQSSASLLHLTELPIMEKLSGKRPDCATLPSASSGTPPDKSVQLARNTTELAVAAIWESILGIDEIDVHAEFIALGGRSIAAVRMLSEIEDKLGAKLTMLEFVQQPTVAALSKLIDGDATHSHWRSLIPLKTTGSKPPVIFIHAVGTHALFMRSVTPYFDADQPVLGLQLVGFNGECEPFSSIEAIAEHYLQEIRSYQSTGPYYFVAHCLGAVVAHEIIERLKQLGEEVALFVVLDARPPLTKPVHRESNRFVSLMRSAASTSEQINYADVAKRTLVHGVYRTSQFTDKLRQKYLLNFGKALDRNQVRMELVHKAVQSGFYAYLGKPIDQKVVLIASDGELNPLHLEWEQLASEFEVIRLPLGHETMFTEPEVGILGENLSKLIEQASGSSGEAANRI